MSNENDTGNDNMPTDAELDALQAQINDAAKAVLQTY